MIAADRQDALDALLRQSDIARLMDILNGDGAETRIVGGAVRNTLLSLPVSDIDLTTTLLPEETMARVKAAGLRSVPTGLSHGTVTVIVKGRPFEVTTLREDIATDGRHAEVRFGRDFVQDALRRDFTINALSLDVAGTVHDYAGGLDDLGRRRVRFIGDAGQRIREDFLRILRFFRFHAQYAEGPLDREGYEASIALRAGLETLSRERVRQETMKLLTASGAVAAIIALAEGGLMQVIIGGVDRRARFARLVELAPDADATLRLAALALATAEDVPRLRERLRLTNQEETRLSALAVLVERFHDHAVIGEAEAKELIYTAGTQGFTDLSRLLAAGERDALSTVATLAERWSAPAMPFTGGDVLALGVPKGPGVGKVLKETERRWIADGFPADPLRHKALLVEALAAQE